MTGAPGLRVLFVEDDEGDAELIGRELARGGWEVASERVETYDGMAAALDRGGWDLVVADYSLPRFSGPAALALCRGRGLDVPFVMVSGSISEEQAVESLRLGAHDFVTKTRLARLGPAVARELRDVENRRARRKAEEERRAAEEKYRALLEHMPALAYIARADDLRRTVFVGPQVEEMTGFAAEEWTADPELWSRRLHPDDRGRVLEAVQRTASAREPFSCEYRFLRKDGQVVWWRDLARFVRDPAGGLPLLHGFVQDVTETRRDAEELRRQREALFQAEKLAAMGELLAGVAHELNNPLAVVIGQASLLRRDVPAGPAAARTEKVLRSAERCGRIVKSFLSLARRQPSERRLLDVNAVVREATELLAYPLHVDAVELRLELDPAGPLVWGDGHQVPQVLINLLTNAHHAVREAPGPRRITVTTRAAGERVVIEVGDSGPGISPELRERVFDPFFTTKPVGEGTGLGLPLCRGIVVSHGGTISLADSTAGATFRVDLPVGAAPDTPPADAAPAPVAGPCSILVVDDEAAVADVLAEILRDDGHRVEVTGDGWAALARIEAGGFDLVISDLRMPGLDGPGLYAEATRRRPGLRFVFITGDTMTARTQDFLEDARVPYLGKPFSLDDVRRALRQALAGTR